MQPPAITGHEVVHALRAAKDAAGETNQTLADKSGVPYSTVCKILAGAVDSPSFVQVAALAAVLHLSLDQLAGFPVPKSDTAAQAQLPLLRESIELYERGVRQRNIIICGLLGFVVFFAMAFVVYVILDLQDPEHGLIRKAQPVSPVAYLLVLAPAAVALAVGHRIGCKHLKL